MTRRTYVFREGKCVEVTPEKAPSFHYVQDDTMRPLAHPCTGEVIDSKSRFRSVTAQNGCYEVGNETQTPSTPKRTRKELHQDMRQAIRDLERTGKLYTQRTISEQIEALEKRR